MPLTDIATVTVEIDTTSLPDTTTPSYSTVIPVESVVAGQMGRHYELDTVQPTRSTVAVDNTNAGYTPGTVVDTDKLVRVRAALTAAAGGGTYTLAAGTTEAVPETVSGFDYAQTQFRLIDYLDALGTRTLQSAIVEQTLYEAPTAYWTFGETPPASALADIAHGQSASLVSLFSLGNSSAGAAALGGAPFWSTDPTTNLAMAPHFTTGTPDAGYAVVLGKDGQGVFITQSIWALRITFQTAQADSSGYLFYQPNQDSNGSENPTYVYLSSGGVLSVIAAPAATWTSSGTYNDGAPHTLLVVVNGTNMSAYVDGVLVGTGSGASSTGYTTRGAVTVGAHITPRGYGDSYYHGQVGQVVLWDGTAPPFPAKHQSAIGGFTGETADLRIKRTLAWAGYTGSTSAFEFGTTPLGVQLCAGKTAAQDCLDAAAAEDGIFYVRRNGLCHFRARASRYAQSRVVTLNTTATTGAYRYPPAAGGAPAGGYFASPGTSTILPIHNWPLTIGYDRQHMVNDFYATRPGGPTIRVFDPTSKSSHRTRNGGYTASSPLSFPVTTDAELAARASWHLTRYKDPAARCDDVQFRPFTVPALAVYAATLEPFDRIGLDNLPSNAPASSMDFLVESIGQPKIENGEWICALTLSPFIQTFIPGDPTFGVVGVYPMPY